MAGLGFGYGEAMNLFVTALTFWYGGQQILSGGTDIEGMFVTVMTVTNMGMVIDDTLHIFPDFEEALDSAISYFEIMVQPPEIISKVKGLVPKACEGNVSFENVRFSYPTRPERPILKDFTISVKRGQTLALVGHSGCGKSTSVALLERLYRSTGGTIRLDGADITSLDISWLRKQMGYIGQEPVIFARFLSRLPDGLDTYVGERGTQLSGGQKQRIAIARALIRDPKILLLEATSALDSESKKTVQVAIDEARKGRTTIVIAHRLSPIKDADIIAVVDNGEVIEAGTHNELIERQGAYYNYVQMQDLEHAAV